MAVNITKCHSFLCRWFGVKMTQRIKTLHQVGESHQKWSADFVHHIPPPHTHTQPTNLQHHHHTYTQMNTCKNKKTSAHHLLDIFKNSIKCGCVQSDRWGTFNVYSSIGQVVTGLRTQLKLVVGKWMRAYIGAYAFYYHWSFHETLHKAQRLFKAKCTDSWALLCFAKIKQFVLGIKHKSASINENTCCPCA